MIKFFTMVDLIQNLKPISKEDPALYNAFMVILDAYAGYSKDDSLMEKEWNNYKKILKIESALKEVKRSKK